MQHRNWKVWSKKEKRWLDYLVMLPSGRVGEVVDGGHVACLKDADVDVVFQTGLKDKNGKEIYEGDIVKYGERHTNVVEWRDTGFWLYEKESDQNYWPHSMEIIGNIYENPELLKI